MGGNARPGRNPAKHAEELAQKCYFLLDYFEQCFDGQEFRQLIPSFRKGIDGALAKGHVAALRMAYGDLAQYMNDLCARG